LRGRGTALAVDEVALEILRFAQDDKKPSPGEKTLKKGAAAAAPSGGI